MLTLAEVLAFLPPQLRALFDDESVTELMLNGAGPVWCERGGRLELVEGVEVDAGTLRTTAIRIARPLGYEADQSAPLVDARLPDGSRVAIACPPITTEHAITVRRFGGRALRVDDLVQSGSLPKQTAAHAVGAIAARKNVLISGGTGTGKTTLLQALAGALAGGDRVIVIEDTRELRIDVQNCLRLEARLGGGNGRVTIRDLVRHSLRHRPDRIIVGEVRGAEGLDLLQALSTGHGGSLSTIHADSADLAPNRLALCAMLAGAQLPWEVLCQMVADSIHLCLHLERDTATGWRGVRQARVLRAYDPEERRWIWEPAGAPASDG